MSEAFDEYWKPREGMLRQAASDRSDMNSNDAATIAFTVDQFVETQRAAAQDAWNACLTVTKEIVEETRKEMFG
jgi:hypothetical protein